MGPWAAALAVLFTLIALSQQRRFAPECQGVFALVGTCVVLLALHPNHQARFFASWVFAIWVCAGTGAALVFQWLMRQIKRQLVRAASAACVVAALALATAATKPDWPVAAAYAHQTPGPSEFELLPVSLPYIAGSHRLGMFRDSTGDGFFLGWNAMVQCRCRIAFDHPGDLKEASYDRAMQQISSFVEATESDVIIAILEPGNEVPDEWVIDAMKNQGRFALVANNKVPNYPAEILIWRR